MEKIEWWKNAKQPAAAKKASKKSYEKGIIEQTLLCTRVLLEILGIWSFMTENPKTPYAHIIAQSIIVFIVNSILLLVLVPPVSLHVLYDEKNFLGRLEGIGAIIYLTSAFFKYVILIYRSKVLAVCIEVLKNDWLNIETDADHKIMVTNANIALKFTFVSGAFSYAGGLLYNFIVPLFMPDTVNEFNETLHYIPYSGIEYFFNPHTSPNYEFVFTALGLLVIVTQTLAVTTGHLAAMLVAHICGQIQILITRLNDLLRGIEGNEKSDVLHKRITVIIKSHVKILRLSKNTEEFLREICLVEMLCCTLVMCMSEFYMLDDASTLAKRMSFSVMVISLGFCVFILCYIGNFLEEEQCLEVGKVSYMIDWYKLPSKESLGLVLLIAIANRPRKLTAGGFMDLTIRSFGVFLKTSFVYMNILRTVT